MKRPDWLPPEIERLIPSAIDKGIYPRFHTAKDGSISLIWWVRVWKNRKPISQSSESSRYSDAEALKRKLIGELETGARAGGDVDQVRVADVLETYISECKVRDQTRRDYRNIAENRIVPKLGRVRVVKLTTDRLQQFRKARVAEIVAKKKPKTAGERAEITKSANTTVNRNFALLRAALIHGQRRTPQTVLRIPHFPTTSEKDNARQGFLEADKYVALRDAFRDPAVRLLFVVGYHIGCRSGELKKFEWHMVDVDEGVIRLPGRITKNGKPRTVPVFGGDMMDHLRAEKKQHDEFYPDSPWVFSRAGVQVRSFRDDWDRATDMADCPDLYFHDLRRTAVRNMVRLHGLDRTVAKKISGHLTDSMFERYNIVDEEDIKAAKRKVDSAAHLEDQKPTLSGDLLATLASIPEDKLRAVIALLK